MPNLTALPSVYAADLEPGARNAIRTCLRIEPHERVSLITDVETEEIAASLADQILQVGGTVDAHVMEDYGPRPMLALPDPIRHASQRLSDPGRFGRQGSKFCGSNPQRAGVRAVTASTG